MREKTDSDSVHLASGDSVAVSGSGLRDLHAAIVNLPQKHDSAWSFEQKMLYALGHMEARHGAAELVAAQQPLIEELLHALLAIAAMPVESNEWDAVEKYDTCRELARNALKATGAPHAE